jgi:hypothetical protein
MEPTHQRFLALLVVAAACLVSVDAGCTITVDTNLVGNDLMDAGPATTADACCKTCQTTPLCKFFSWNAESGGDKHCWLKKSDAGKTPAKGVVSGSISSGPTPAPGPTPPPIVSFPWLNASIPGDERVEALIKAMSVAEKTTQLNTDAPAITRLRLPQYGWWSEAAHGVAWAGKATVFPASIALAATFDTEGLENVGVAIGMEGRAKFNDAFKKSGGTESLFGLTFFAPNINLVRDVRWGRGQETYGEDPVLTARLGVAVIKGMQRKLKPDWPPLVLATSKHFFAYNLESDFAAGGSDGQYRLKYDAIVSETDLRQTFLPAFAATIRDGGARSVVIIIKFIASIRCAHIKNEITDVRVQ